MELENNNSQQEALLGEDDTLQQGQIKTFQQVKNWKDKRIIEQILAGDHDLFFELVHRYEKKLFKLATVITGNVVDAEDALQEAFLSAYNSLHRFKGKSTFYTWIYRIVINKAKDLRARQKKTQQKTVDNHDFEVYDQRLNIPKEIEDSEMLQFLFDKVNNLKEIYREIIILRFFEQMSYQDIADILGIREGTVKSRLFKAKAQLKKEILKDGKGDEMIHALL